MPAAVIIPATARGVLHQSCRGRLSRRPIQRRYVPFHPISSTPYSHNHYARIIALSQRPHPARFCHRTLRLPCYTRLWGEHPAQRPIHRPKIHDLSPIGDTMRAPRPWCQGRQRPRESHFPDWKLRGPNAGRLRIKTGGARLDFLFLGSSGRWRSLEIEVTCSGKFFCPKGWNLWCPFPREPA